MTTNEVQDTLLDEDELQVKVIRDALYIHKLWFKETYCFYFQCRNLNICFFIQTNKDPNLGQICSKVTLYDDILIKHCYFDLKLIQIILKL